MLNALFHFLWQDPVNLQQYNTVPSLQSRWIHQQSEFLTLTWMTFLFSNAKYCQSSRRKVTPMTGVNTNLCLLDVLRTLQSVFRNSLSTVFPDTSHNGGRGNELWDIIGTPRYQKYLSVYKSWISLFHFRKLVFRASDECNWRNGLLIAITLTLVTENSFRRLILLVDVYTR